MHWNKILLVLMLMLLSWALWIAFLRWTQKGRFEVLEDSPSRFVFRSNFGQFTLHHQTRTLAWVVNGKSASTNLDDIRRVDYLANEGGALGLEFLNGFDFMDLFQTYRDSIERHEIALVTDRHGRVPVFFASRWQRREFLMGWLIAIEDGLMVRLGLLQDVQARAQEVRSLLESRLYKIVP